VKELLSIQEEIGAIVKDSTNPYFKSKYFDINSLLAQVMPLFNQYGLVLLQPLTNIDGHPAIRTKIVKADTQEPLLDEVVPLPPFKDAQAMGSAITYLRRYSLQSALGLQAEDDDANSASRPQMSAPIDRLQLTESFRQYCTKLDASDPDEYAAKVCAFISGDKKTNVAELTDGELRRAVVSLTTKAKEAGV
jgi:hypothetical protein